MQLFARLPPAFLRRLRAVLRLAIPTAVAADTARSVVVTYQLAQQRFQEWEEEDQEATRMEVAALLRGVVRRCAAADSDFWPAFEAHAQADSSSSSQGFQGRSSSSSSGATLGAAAGRSCPAEAEAEGLAADVWQLLGLGPSLGLAEPTSSGGGSPSAAAGADREGAEQVQQHGAGSFGHSAPGPGPAPTPLSLAISPEHAAWAEQEAAQLLRFEQQQRMAAEELSGPTSAAAAAAQAQARVVVVTFSEALSRVAGEMAALGLPWTTLSLSPPPGVVHVTLGDVLDILASTPPARAAASKQQRLGQRLLAAADATAATARAALPWPQLALSRKSALRYAVEWQGMHWPQEPEQPLERDLSCC